MITTPADDGARIELGFDWFLLRMAQVFADHPDYGPARREGV